MKYLKNNRGLLFGVFSVCLFGLLYTSCNTPSEPAVQAIVKINSKEKQPYNRMIFGGFIEHFHRQVYGGIFEPGSELADRQGFRTDVIDALKELKLPVIRWPGGCFVDGYHWLNGVGKERKPKDDVRWGTIEPNTFGTDEFVEFCHRIGAEPYICHNGLAEIQEMADWVEYCNLDEGKFAAMRKENGHTQPFDVKIWSVGNERGGAAYYNRVLNGAKAMKALDSTIYVTCSGTHGGGNIDPNLFKTAGEYLDYVSIHRYWIQNFQKYQPKDYMSCILMSENPDQFIEEVIQSLEKNKMRDQIKIAFDEWNLRSWHHPGFPKDKKVDYNDPEIINLIQQRNKSLDNSLYTMADALFSASFLNACLRHAEDVVMANVAPIVNQSGPLFVHSKGVVRRPQFHTMSMYANLLEDYVTPTSIQSDSITNGKQSIPAVDALATSDQSGKRKVVSLVNRQPEQTLNCKISFEEMTLDGEYEATILSGDSPDAFNDIDHPDSVAPQHKRISIRNGIVQLPPHSLTMIVVQ